ncbi:MAG: protein kinase [Fuerstiella sp.]
MTADQPDLNSDADLIDEACREEFELAWLSGSRKEIADCLPDPSDRRYRPTLEELICIRMELEWKAVARARCGTTLLTQHDTLSMSPTFVEDYLQQFPDMVETARQERLIRQEFLIRRRLGDRPARTDYQKRFPRVNVSRLLDAEQLQTADGLYESTTDTEQSPTPLEIDGYELLDRVGAGGMGVVYRARQLAADRIVALKLIRADRLAQADPEHRRQVLERFQVEAQATARLDHPNVVGIFEVNTSNPDQPWFSMQFVDGETLSERLADGPLSGQEAAQITQQMARAVEAAHQRGILHRDLKPQNVFLQRTSGRVLVGDFGLAKLEVDDSERTGADDILGTPAYMSPEQIRNSAGVGPPADIWSIGATLYHMLTGRPPFQAASAMDTLRHVLDYEPASPRKLNPEVDRDMDTMCIKCLQKNPAQRYATVTDLTHDLSLYLSGCPITARPVSRLEHVVRWCRRNPLPAGLAALALAGILTAVIGLWIGYRTATVALLESDSSHLMARQTVRDLFTDVSETVLLDRPGLQPLRRRLHERTLGYFRRFVESGRNSPALQEEMGEVWYRIGRIEKELGHPDKAETAFLQALKIQRQLVTENPSVARRTSLSTTWNALGAFSISQQRWDDAADFLRHAGTLRDELVREVPTDPELRRLRANTIMNLGAVQRNLDDVPGALDLFEEAVALQRSVLTEGTTDIETTRRLQRDLGMALYNTANAALDSQQTSLQSDILDPLNSAIHLFQQLLTEEPDSYSDRRRLILCRQLLAEATVDPTQAAGAAEAAAADMESLIAQNPAVPALIGEWAQLRLLAGRLYNEAYRSDLAFGQFDAVVTVLHADETPDEEPDHNQRPDQQQASQRQRARVLAVATAELALAAAQLARADAPERLRQARQLLQQRLAQTAADPEFADLLQQVTTELNNEPE